MQKLKCKNIKCQYSWEFKGKSPFYASCPRCRTVIKLDQKSEQTELGFEVKKDA